MKTTTVVASLLVASSLLLGVIPTTSAFASSKNKVEKAITDNDDISVKYMGESEGFMYVKITLAHPAAQDASILILDTDGSKLYQEVLTNKEFSRIIKLAPEEFEKLTVRYIGSDKEMEKTFTINPTDTDVYEIEASTK